MGGIQVFGKCVFKFVLCNLFLEDFEGYVAFFGNPWIILSSTKPNIQGKWFLSHAMSAQ